MAHSLKKREILTYTTIGMNPEDAILRELCQAQKGKFWKILFVPGTQSISERQKGARGVESRSHCLMGTMLQFCKMKSSGDGWW